MIIAADKKTATGGLFSDTDFLGISWPGSSILSLSYTVCVHLSNPNFGRTPNCVLSSVLNVTVFLANFDWKLAKKTEDLSDGCHWTVAFFVFYGYGE